MSGHDNFADAAPPALRLAEGAVLDGGGEYVGIQRGSRHKGIPDMVLFNDPMTRTTLALVVSATPVTAQQVRAKIAHSRFVFARVRKSRGRDKDFSVPPAQIRTGGFPASGSYLR
jgi:hypothetical protein